jgi:hypothetical protein
VNDVVSPRLKNGLSGDACRRSSRGNDGPDFLWSEGIEMKVGQNLIESFDGD